MIYVAGSCLLTVISLCSTWLLSRKNVYGWHVALIFQVLATPYDLFTHQYAFILLTPVSGWIAMQGIRKWRSDNERRAEES